MLAALFVETDGVYANVPCVIPWDEKRDARQYQGPWPVVAHPPCQRWGRMAKGGPSNPNSARVGDDKNCFASALLSLHNYGGVIEHPADSKAWKWFGLNAPKRYKGWQKIEGPLIWFVENNVFSWTDARASGEWYTCYVEQYHYGHTSRKGTRLLTNKVPRDRLPELNWTRGPQIIDPKMLAKHGYEKARRIGTVALVGGKDKTKIRNATPATFRDVLLKIAGEVSNVLNAPIS